MLTLLILACATQAPPVEGPPPPPIEAPMEPQAPIALTAPAAGAHPGGAIAVRGSAQVWEGRVNVRLVDASGAVLASESVTASASAPERGAFALTLQAPASLRGEAAIEAYASSPRDGSPMGLTRVELLIE